MRTTSAAMLLLFLCPIASFGQVPDPDALKQVQQEKLAQVNFMNGQWRGTAWRMAPSGERIEFTQTERVGDMLDGCVKVIEGCGYDADGEKVFNAMAVLAYDAASQELVMRSHAEGRVGNFIMEAREDGFGWEVPAGPNKIRYTAKVADGEWFEYGELSIPGRDPMRIFEMRLKKVGQTEWPAAGAVPPVEAQATP